MYYHIQVPKKTAPIQFSKPKSQTNDTTAAQNNLAVKKKPSIPEFKSIFEPLWGSSQQAPQSIQANSVQLKSNIGKHHTGEAQNLYQKRRDGEKQKGKIESSVIQLFPMTKAEVMLREKPEETSDTDKLPANTRIKIKKRDEGETDVDDKWEKIEVTTGEKNGKVGWVLKEDLKVEEQTETEEVALSNATQLFDELKNAKITDSKGRKINIPFDDMLDYCAARAHKMAKLLTKKGYASEKAFVVAKKDNKLKVSGNSVWEYHVAPVINVKIDAEVKQYIIDPSLFAKPVPILEWLQKMGAENFKFRTEEYVKNEFTAKARNLDPSLFLRHFRTEDHYYITPLTYYWPIELRGHLPERQGDIEYKKTGKYSMGKEKLIKYAQSMEGMEIE